jgi:endonuclease-3
MAPKSKPPEIETLLSLLKSAYPSTQCALSHTNPFELLVATILSAQCTDKRVNMVTPALFAKYPTPAAMACADPADVEDLIRSTNFYRNKTKALIGMARSVSEAHGGQVPRTLEELITLPGVARKTANVVLGVGFKQAVGVVVDTHVARLSHRLGLTRETDPVKIERDLMAVLPPTEWIDFSHRLIDHGRTVCSARAPLCDACPLVPVCPSAFQFPRFMQDATAAVPAKKVKKATGRKKAGPRKKAPAKKGATRKVASRRG